MLTIIQHGKSGAFISRMLQVLKNGYTCIYLYKAITWHHQFLGPLVVLREECLHIIVATGNMSVPLSCCLHFVQNTGFSLEVVATLIKKILSNFPLSPQPLHTCLIVLVGSRFS